MSRSSRLLSLVSGSALGLALLASSAGAQEYAPYGASYYNQGQGEEVIVTVPRHHPQTGKLGAPIEDVSLSRPVRFDDLDLNTYWGVYRLKSRIAFAARTMCNQLDAFYPVSASDEPSQGAFGNTGCFRRAYDDAMYQADQAIRASRAGYGYYGYSGQ